MVDHRSPTPVLGSYVWGHTGRQRSEGCIYKPLNTGVPRSREEAGRLLP